MEEVWACNQPLSGCQPGIFFTGFICHRDQGGSKRYVQYWTGGSTRSTEWTEGESTVPNDRISRDGELIMTDTCVEYLGHGSDLGRTWLCAARPHLTSQQRDQYQR